MTRCSVSVSRLFVLFAAISFSLCSIPTHAQELLLVDGEPCDAQLVQVDTLDEGKLHFQTAQGQRTVRLQEMVRWSTPRNLPKTGELILTDGSQLALADAWTGSAVVRITGGTATCTTAQFAKVELPRLLLKAIVLNTYPKDGRQDKLRQRLLAWRGEGDQLHLASGDVLTGRLLTLEQVDGQEKNGAAESTVTFLSDTGQHTILLNRIAGIALGPRESNNSLEFQSTQTEPIPPSSSSKSAAPARLTVGLHDGSWIVVQSLVANEERLQMTLSTGMIVTGGNVNDIVALQSLGDRIIYLSDLRPTEYRHAPYLEIPWPFAKDRNVLGDRLRVGGKNYSKGIGMHTASRLTYQIAKEWYRFAAEIAVDDAASGGGSIIFRVYLWQNNAWQSAYTSPVVRGTDPPLRIYVDLFDAEKIALVADYADRGDQRDYANWLDARFLRSAARR